MYETMSTGIFRNAAMRGRLTPKATAFRTVRPVIGATAADGACSARKAPLNPIASQIKPSSSGGQLARSIIVNQRLTGALSAIRLARTGGICLAPIGFLKFEAPGAERSW
jgi:hypothetical protein